MERFLTDDRTLSWLVLGLATVGVITALGGADGNIRPLLVVAYLPFVVRVAVPRFPTWVALLATTVVAVLAASRDPQSEGVFFLSIIGVVPVMASDPHRARAYSASALALGAPAVAWLVTSDRSEALGWPFWCMGTLLTVVMGALLFRQRTLTDQLIEARQQLTDQAVADERRRISRELHDLVGHSLSVVMLHVTGARHLLRRDVDEAERALIEAERAGRASLVEIRHAVGLLRDAEGFGTAPTPGVGDLADLVDEYRRGGMDVGLDVHGVSAAVDGVTGLTIYRLTQESLANVAKHAPEAITTVDISVGSDQTTVEVASTCRDRPLPAQPGGMGIVGMTERARALGGDLTAGPTATGWLVTARLPHVRAEAGIDRPQPA